MINISNEICCVLNLIKHNGYKAYLIGGYVRDSLLNIETYDVDIATDASPNKITDIFKEYNVEKRFMRFGSVKFEMGKHHFEITTFRKEGEYIDYRRPKEIEFISSIDEDLYRRDFTINALCFDGEHIIDNYEGIKHLNNKIIKTIKDPFISFHEDALRVLRAIRFASKLGFGIEENTHKGMIGNCSNLKKIKFETKYKEIKGILEGKCFLKIIREYKDILSCAFSLKELKIELFNEEMNYEEKEALFFYHSDVFVKNKYLKNKNIIFDNNKIHLKKLLMKYGKEDIYNTLYFNSNILKINQKEYNLLSEIINNNECYNLEMLNLKGDDLLNINVKGNKIGKCLNYALEAVIEEKCINDKEVLLKYLNNINLI